MTAQEGYTQRVACLLVAMLVVVPGGCVAEDRSPAYEILFVAPGQERMNPSGELWMRLHRADAAQKRSMIRELSALLEKEGGYARIVAARTLLDFLDVFPEYWTKEAALAVATEVIKIADPVEVYRTVSMQHYDEMEEVVRPIEVRIKPSCYMEWDRERFLLRDSLPTGWKARLGSIEVDGRLVLNHPEEYDSLGVRSRINLRRAVGGDDRLHGQHVIVSRLLVIAPDGTRVPIEGTLAVGIWYEHEIRGPK